MRIFKNYSEMYSEVGREIKHNGVVYQSKSVQDKEVLNDAGYLTKELQGYSFVVKDTSVGSMRQFINDQKLNDEWLSKDFVERISEKDLNPGEAWVLRKETWEPFIKDGKFSYTYSERIGRQVTEVVEHLKKSPLSRHALINIYDQTKDHKNRGGIARVPCSMFYQFLIRDGKVNTTYVMRSCDFNEHFCYDLLIATLLGREVASKLSLPHGDLTFFATSLHAFKKDNEEVF